MEEVVRRDFSRDLSLRLHLICLKNRQLLSEEIDFEMPQKKAAKRKRSEFVSSQHTEGSRGRFTSSSSLNIYQKDAVKARVAAAKAKEAVAIYNNDNNAVGYGVYETYRCYDFDPGRQPPTHIHIGQYIGQLKNGIPHGFGVRNRGNSIDGITFTRRQEGEWKNGTFQGFGIFTSDNGVGFISSELEEGKWCDDGMHFISGVLTESEEVDEILYTIITEGQNIWDIKNADHIIIRYHEGNVFEGSYEHEPVNYLKVMMNGTCRFSDGRVYEGKWGHFHEYYPLYTGENCPNGYGVMRYPDGSVYEGEWKDGKKNGQGKLSRPNAPLREEEWKDGELVDYQEPFDINDEDENW